MSSKIQYIISEGCLDSKRNGFFTEEGFINENLKDVFFLEKICKFISDRTNLNYILSVDCIKYFWKDYYNNYYKGDNLPWEAKIFINDQWVKVYPTNDEIFEYIKYIREKRIEFDLNKCKDYNDEINETIEKLEESYKKQNKRLCELEERVQLQAIEIYNLKSNAACNSEINNILSSPSNKPTSFSLPKEKAHISKNNDVFNNKGNISKDKLFTPFYISNADFYIV